MELVLGILGSGVISTLISCIFQTVNNKKQKLGRFEEGMKLLLLSDVRANGKKLIEQGKVTREEYAIFNASYQAYKDLGGDGWADGVKAKVDILERDFED
jgi:hypothetical protein